MSNGKVMMILLTAGLIKKPMPFAKKSKIKVELHLSNHATKSNSKSAKSVDTSQVAKKDDLSKLKLEVDKLDIDELKNVSSNLNSLRKIVGILDVDKLPNISVDLKKLSDVAEKEVVKNCIW